MSCCIPGLCGVGVVGVFVVGGVVGRCFLSLLLWRGLVLWLWGGGFVFGCV